MTVATHGPRHAKHTVPHIAKTATRSRRGMAQNSCTLPRQLMYTTAASHRDWFLEHTLHTHTVHTTHHCYLAHAGGVNNNGVEHMPTGDNSCVPQCCRRRDEYLATVKRRHSSDKQPRRRKCNRITRYRHQCIQSPHSPHLIPRHIKTPTGSGTHAGHTRYTY
jgi:hypothetical protein